MNNDYNIITHNNYLFTISFVTLTTLHISYEINILIYLIENVHT